MTTTRNTAKKATCAGSGQWINAFPGEDVCPVCQKWVRVRQDSTIAKHAARAKHAVKVEEA